MQEVTSNEDSTLNKQCSHRFTRECGCSCRSKLYYHTIAAWHIWYFEVPSECSLQYMVIREWTERFALLALKTIQSTILQLILLLSLPSQDISNLRALSKSQNRPAGPWPDQSFWQSDKLFPRVFAEKSSPSCKLFRVVLIKSEILITTGMVWPVSSDKWKAPLGPGMRLCW